MWLKLQMRKLQNSLRNAGKTEARTWLTQPPGFVLSYAPPWIFLLFQGQAFHPRPEHDELSSEDLSQMPAWDFLLTLTLLWILIFFFFSWRLITLQYCSGFCHTLTWISHGYTCIPHSDPPSHHPLHPIPLGLPSAPGPSTCLMHPTWAGDLFHPR